MPAAEPFDPCYRLLSNAAGAHSVRLVRTDAIEICHYSFGEGVPYEYATLLTFAAAAWPALAAALDLAADADPAAIIAAIAARFRLLGDVERFAQRHAVPFERATDFQP